MTILEVLLIYCVDFWIRESHGLGLRWLHRFLESASGFLSGDTGNMAASTTHEIAGLLNFHLNSSYTNWSSPPNMKQNFNTLQKRWWSRAFRVSYLLVRMRSIPWKGGCFLGAYGSYESWCYYLYCLGTDHIAIQETLCKTPFFQLKQEFSAFHIQTHLTKCTYMYYVCNEHLEHLQVAAGEACLRAHSYAAWLMDWQMPALDPSWATTRAPWESKGPHWLKYGLCRTVRYTKSTEVDMIYIYIIYI